MSIRPLISMPLLILCAVTTGCGTSPEPKTKAEKSATNVAVTKLAPLAPDEKAAANKGATEDKAAAEKKAAEEKAGAEKKAAQEKAAASSYIKVKVEVELRGLLSFTEKAVTITTTERYGNPKKPDFFETKWVLDFGEDKEMRAKAKGLDGKTVLATGSAILTREFLWVATGYEDSPLRGLGKSPLVGEYISHFGPEPKLTVKSLVAATKE